MIYTKNRLANGLFVSAVHYIECEIIANVQSDWHLD